jgi:hypothetical protein
LLVGGKIVLGAEMNTDERFKQFFNERDLNGIESLFAIGVRSVGLFTKTVDFESSEELEKIYQSLFEINPKVKVKVENSIESAEHLILMKHYFDFNCGAQSWTVWNCRLEDGKIAEIYHHSKHQPGK